MSFCRETKMNVRNCSLQNKTIKLENNRLLFFWLCEEKTEIGTLCRLIAEMVDGKYSRAF